MICIWQHAFLTQPFHAVPSNCRRSECKTPFFIHEVWIDHEVHSKEKKEGKMQRSSEMDSAIKSSVIERK